MGKKSYVSLRIDSSILNSQEISKRLNLVPEKVLEKGEYLYKSDKKRSETTWLYKNDFSKEKSLDKHLENILNTLEEKKEEFIGLSNDGCSFELFCFYSSDNGQGSVIFDNNLIKRLATWPFDVVIDLYLHSSQ